MTKPCKLFLASIATFAVLHLPTAQALDSKPVLGLDIAKQMADACEAKAKQEGWNLNIAVVDDGANLMFFQRMPNAFLGSIDIAINKAKTSARLPFPTRGIANIVYGEDGKGGAVPGLAHVDDVMAFPGGLPIKAGDVLVGAIGISGATGDQDEECAQAGLDAVAEMLK
ncbi:MAG: GlcG/HbpS family heme-binding protein [Gammaproteobacteria bacterium]